jgi:hypothetical protein
VVPHPLLQVYTHIHFQYLHLLIHWLLQFSFGPSPLLIFWFPNLFRHMVGLLGRVISSSQGLYLHRTTQHRKTRTNIHTLSGIRSSVRAIKALASVRAATGSAIYVLQSEKHYSLCATGLLRFQLKNVTKEAYNCCLSPYF